MDIQKIGIIGAGQMGNGIAHVMSLAGYDVLLNDVNEDALTQAMARIDKNMERQVSREKISAENKAAAIGRIITTSALPDLGQTDLVIEAATEKEVVKQSILDSLLPHLQPARKSSTD